MPDDEENEYDLRRVISMLRNKIELLEEDLQCVQMYLDTKDIPREDREGAFSIIGRIKILESNGDTDGA